MRSTFFSEFSNIPPSVCGDQSQLNSGQLRGMLAADEAHLDPPERKSLQVSSAFPFVWHSLVLLIFHFLPVIPVNFVCVWQFSSLSRPKFALNLDPELKVLLNHPLFLPHGARQPHAAPLTSSQVEKKLATADPQTQSGSHGGFFPLTNVTQFHEQMLRWSDKWMKIKVLHHSKAYIWGTTLFFLKNRQFDQ